MFWACLNLAQQLFAIETELHNTLKKKNSQVDIRNRHNVVAMESEIASCPKYYGDLEVRVYAPRPYYPLSMKKDEYSQQIIFGKKTDLSDYFFEEVKDIFPQLPFKPDLLVIVPASRIRKFSPTMVNLGKKLSRALSMPARKSIKRVKEGIKLALCSTQEERYTSVSDSFRAIRRFRGEKIVLLDDTLASGATLLECARILRKAGASDIAAVCLAINKKMNKNEVCDSTIMKSVANFETGYA